MFSSVSEAKKIINSLKDALKRDDGCSDFEVFSMIDALNQVFTTIIAVNKRDKTLNKKEISDVGEQGLLLIDNLINKLVTQNIDSHTQDVQHVALIIANWVIKHNGELVNIQLVVDSLAFLANAVDDKVSLLQLATFMSQVANACNDMIQHDLDNSDLSRPWRTLNMNRGIVATRTHDLDLMRQVFSEIIKAIPLDAPSFFKEGMSEMARLNYPEAVQELMQEFYDKTQLPVIH